MSYHPTQKTVWGDSGVQKGVCQKLKVIPGAKEQGAVGVFVLQDMCPLYQQEHGNQPSPAGAYSCNSLNRHIIIINIFAC